jgi:lipopolysaccharide/colanic/teichoic acid biosynthesis glycosyltransferase
MQQSVRRCIKRHGGSVPRTSVSSGIPIPRQKNILSSVTGPRGGTSSRQSSLSASINANTRRPKVLGLITLMMRRSPVSEVELELAALAAVENEMSSIAIDAFLGKAKAVRKFARLQAELELVKDRIDRLAADPQGCRARLEQSDPAPHADWAPVLRRAAKRAFDIVVATAGLILLSPMLLLVSIAIKTGSRRPAVPPQIVYGYNNPKIRAPKFQAILVRRQAEALQYASRFGTILRQTGIDDLLPLVNVLRGEMSIVGPAPYGTASFFAEQIPLIQQRQRVKPGLTGWAQVHGCRGESDNAVRRRIEFDRYYIANRSFLFDMRIILMTLFSKDAYLN